MELVIVAIPKKDDRVWNISTEKVPHMTMLYLGEVTDEAKLLRIEQAVGHVAETSLSKFGGQVTRRGELGPEKADVIFFSPSSVQAAAVARAGLLATTEIREAYLAVQQYPQWTPHLTLGYPATPAKSESDGTSGIFYVEFDSIALWLGESDGPTFQLKDPWEGQMTSPDQVLTHYGVKGMKWGVRRDGTHDGAEITTSRLARSSQDVTAKQKPGQFVRTSGGRKQGASEDAVKVAVSRQYAKKSTTDALSTKQLQEAVNRMNLEVQYHTLLKKTDRRSRGQKFIQAILKDQGTQKKVANVAKKAVKTAATA